MSFDGCGCGCGCGCGVDGRGISRGTSGGLASLLCTDFPFYRIENTYVVLQTNYKSLPLYSLR